MPTRPTRLGNDRVLDIPGTAPDQMAQERPSQEQSS